MKIDWDILKSKNNICIAVSGGMDSMALCHILLTNAIPFSIAHCNFQLRGDDSHADELFVKSFSEKHHIPFFCERYDTAERAKQNKTSIEMEARNLRYDFFHRLSTTYGFDAFLLAHHADDNVETIFMRIISGTGIYGLRGIPVERKPNYFRPLLNVSRKEIEDYVISNQITYRTDQSNHESVYKRNKIRNEVLPQIAAINPSYCDSLLSLSKLSVEYSAILDSLFHDIKQQFMSKGHVNLHPYADKPFLSTLLYYILSDYSPNRQEIQQIAESLKSTESKKNACGNHWVELKNDTIYSLSFIEASDIIFDTYEEMCHSDELLIELADDTFEQDAIYFDVDKLNFPITFRSAQNGDTIRTIGMNGKSKKITSLFQEKKYTISQKKQRFILEDSEGEIIGVVGLSSSLKTKIDAETKHKIKITSRHSHIE